MDGKVRLGLVGCGGISRGLYVDLLTGFADRARVVAVCDLLPERAGERSAQFRDTYLRRATEAEGRAATADAPLERERLLALAADCRAAGRTAPRVHADLERFARDDDLEAVIVTTQPAMHPVAAIAAAEAGRHVFTEGPMAPTLREADAMVDAARRNTVKLSVQYCTRFFREARQARLAIESGRLGRIVMGRVDASWYHTMAYYNKDAYRGTWRGEGGGSVFHHGRYASDLYLHLMGEPLAEVAAFTGRFLHDIEYEDASSAALRFRSGALGHVTTTICAHRNDAIDYDRVEILGEKASLQVYRGVDWAATPPASTFGLSVSSEDDEYTTELREYLAEAVPPDGEDYQVRQMRLFLEAVRQDRDVPISGESARAHVELARATYKSAFTRTVVRLPLAADDPFYGPEGTTPSWGRGSVGAWERENEGRGARGDRLVGMISVGSTLPRSHDPTLPRPR